MDLEIDADLLRGKLHSRARPQSTLEIAKLRELLGVLLRHKIVRASKETKGSQVLLVAKKGTDKLWVSIRLVNLCGFLQSMEKRGGGRSGLFFFFFSPPSGLQLLQSLTSGSFIGESVEELTEFRVVHTIYSNLLFSVTPLAYLLAILLLARVVLSCQHFEAGNVAFQVSPLRVRFSFFLQFRFVSRFHFLSFSFMTLMKIKRIHRRSNLFVYIFSVSCFHSISFTISLFES